MAPKLAGALEIGQSITKNRFGIDSISAKPGGGIGFSTVKAFATQSPSHLIVAGRNPTRIQGSIDALKVNFPKVELRCLELDLSNQKSVREAAAKVLTWKDVPTMDILVNNAAVMNLPERMLNEDGIETQFATNHVGNLLFTCLIIPKLFKVAETSPRGATRVINVSYLSSVVAGMSWSDINFNKINKALPEAEQPPYSTHTLE